MSRSRAGSRVDADAVPASLRIPPHSAEAEVGLLGSILLDPERVLDACATAQIVPDSFFARQIRVLFEAAVELHGAGKGVDLVTVTDHLRSTGRLDDAGGETALERIVDATPTAAHADFYIDIVRKKHLLRTILRITSEAQEKCYLEQTSAETVLSETEQAVLGISETQTSDIVSWKDAIKRAIRNVELSFDHGGALAGLSTGLKNLDRLMYGLRNSEMIVLAARPSMGKTSLAMNICENVAFGRGGDGVPKPVAIFSCEMSQESLITRMLCAHARLSMRDIHEGYKRQKEVITRLTKAAGELEKAPFYIDDTAGLDVMDLRARARRMKKRFGIRLIMIDYLQLLNSRERADQGLQVETSHISANIKAMAKELDVPVLVLSQLNRGSEQRDNTGKPKLSDLRDSGAIEQDADVVLLLRRPCKNPKDPEFQDKSLAYVDVAKHRNGPTGEAKLDFQDEYTRFTDRADARFGDAGNEVEVISPTM